MGVCFGHRKDSPRPLGVSNLAYDYLECRNALSGEIYRWGRVWFSLYLLKWILVLGSKDLFCGAADFFLLTNCLGFFDIRVQKCTH